MFSYPHRGADYRSFRKESNDEFPRAFFSRVTVACPVTTDLTMRVNVRTTNNSNISRVTVACPVTTDFTMRVNVRTTNNSSNSYFLFANYYPPQ